MNINAINVVSHALIPKLLQREASKRSAMINIASTGAYTQGNAFGHVYCATKAYDLSLGKSLTVAYKDRIDVLTATPASTKSNMNSGRYVFSIESETFVNSTLNQLGYVTVTMGNWQHAIEPYVMRTPFIGWIIQNVDNRRREEWKKEEAAKKAQEQNK